MSNAILPSADTIGDQPTANEAIDALDNEVSLLHYGLNGVIRVMRAITTHSQDANGNPDSRCLDCNEVDAMYDYAEDLRTALPQEFSQCKVARDREEGRRGAARGRGRVPRTHQGLHHLAHDGVLGPKGLHQRR